MKRSFKKAENATAPVTAVPQTSVNSADGIFSAVSLNPCQNRLYAALRDNVPIIDAAILKLLRLTGGFKVVCGDKGMQKSLEDFLRRIPVNGTSVGISAFIENYLDQLLTYGTAVGEVVTDNSGRICGLYNAPLEAIEIRQGKSPLDVKFYTHRPGGAVPVSHPERILFSVLQPEPGKFTGKSLLKGLPFVSAVLLQIYRTIGLNWERVGNVRFAVTYKPQNDAVDKAFAKERAMQVAKEWQNAMQNSDCVKDFVAVGDVSIRVIGADNQVLDSEVPVRQLLEQIVAKTGLPPFMLGLNWSSTERMSSQQSDVLTSELESYRRILTPIVEKICRLYLYSQGRFCPVEIEWDDITLQDEVEESKARLYLAQARKIEAELPPDKGGM